MPHNYRDDSGAPVEQETAQSAWAVVPVKSFARAKGRLSSVLRLKERSVLARLMLEDVLDALAATRELSGIVVVTQDPEASAIARHFGCVVIADNADDGINPAISAAARFLADRPNAAMIVVPADIPHLSPRVVSGVIESVSRASRVSAIAAKDGGTNMLACRPAGLIQPSFGPQSFQHHESLAREAGAVFNAIIDSEIACDIDRPEDIATFLSFASATRTHAFLETLNIDFSNEAARQHSAIEPAIPV